MPSYIISSVQLTPWRLGLLLLLAFGRLQAVVVDPGPGRVLQLQMHTAATAGALKPGTELSAPAAVTVRSGKRVPMAGPAQRGADVSSQHIVIVGLDPDRNEVWRSIQLDPRLLRGESAALLGGSGPGISSYRRDATFSVTPPAALSIERLRIYKPRWTGVTYELDLISEAVVDPR